VQLPDGRELNFPQAIELARLVEVAGKGKSHWHFNECGCCVTMHGPDYSYVIGWDGKSTFFASRGCKC
jgi:hypothetical protein